MTLFVAGVYIEEHKEGEIYESPHWLNLTYSLP